MLLLAYELAMRESPWEVLIDVGIIVGLMMLLKALRKK